MKFRIYIFSCFAAILSLLNPASAQTYDFSKSASSRSSYQESYSSSNPDSKRLLNIGGWQEFDADFDGLRALIGENWPSAGVGCPPAACILVEFENLSLDDIRKINYNFSDAHVYVVGKQERWDDNQFYQMMVFVYPTDNAVEMSVNNQFNNYSNKMRLERLEPHRTYKCKVTGQVRKPLYINVITENPADRVRVELDGDSENALEFSETLAPGEMHSSRHFENVTLGSHWLRFWVNGNSPEYVYFNGQKYSGSENVPMDVKFASDSYSLQFDLRRRRLARVVYDGSKNDSLTIDGKSSNFNQAYELPVGPHTFVVETSNQLRDEKVVNISPDKPIEYITLSPTRYVTFIVESYRYDTRAGGFLTIGNREVFYDPVINHANLANIDSCDNAGGYWRLSYPIGTRLHLVVTVDRYSAGKTIVVDEKMDPVVKIKVKPKNTYGYYYDFYPCIIDVGYTRKHWRTDTESGVIKEGRWPSATELSGIEVGFNGRPGWMLGTSRIGMGLSTGLYYQYFRSNCPQKDKPVMVYNRYEEHVAYVPLRLMFALPVQSVIGFHIEGGVGAEYVFAGRYTDRGSKYVADKDVFFHGHPRRFNLGLEGSVSLHCGMINLKATYSHGITDHKMHRKVKTCQNRWSVSLGICFSTGDYY